MERYVFSLLGLIFSGSIGALFLYVQLWPVISVALVLIGLAVMFVLGVHVGAGAKEKRSPDLVIDRNADDLVDAGVGSFEHR
jgi:hypothetical protein